MCPNLGELDQVIQLRIPHNNKLITTLMESLRLHRPTHNLLFKIMKKQQLLVFPKLISLCLRVNKSLKISQTLCKLNLPNLNKRSYFILPFYPHNRHSQTQILILFHSISLYRLNNQTLVIFKCGLIQEQQHFLRLKYFLVTLTMNQQTCGRQVQCFIQCQQDISPSKKNTSRI